MRQINPVETSFDDTASSNTMPKREIWLPRNLKPFFVQKRSRKRGYYDVGRCNSRKARARRLKSKLSDGIAADRTANVEHNKINPKMWIIRFSAKSVDTTKKWLPRLVKRGQFAMCDTYKRGIHDPFKTGLLKRFFSKNEAENVDTTIFAKSVDTTKKWLPRLVKRGQFAVCDTYKRGVHNLFKTGLLKRFFVKNEAKNVDTTIFAKSVDTTKKWLPRLVKRGQFAMCDTYTRGIHDPFKTGSLKLFFGKNEAENVDTTIF